MTKLNLGSHNKKVEGFINVDVLPLENVDVVWNLTEFPYPWEADSVDEILMMECLEHISFRKTDEVLRECHRILKDGGVINIQVPDIREMMFAYWNGQVCDCVAHKPQNREDGMAKLDCPKCNGYGRVHPNRWLYSFLGAQKHKYDAHLNVFTPETLRDAIIKAGFEKVDLGSDEFKWKIKCKATK